MMNNRNVGLRGLDMTLISVNMQQRTRWTQAKIRLRTFCQVFSLLFGRNVG